MARGPIITPEVEIPIVRVHEEHPKWKAQEVRNVVEGMLRRQNPSFPEKWPSLSKVQKILATVRKREKEPLEEDRPWTIHSMTKYAIPVEALPSVLEAWFLCQSRDITLTIREA